MELLATTLNQAHALFYTLPEGVLPDPSLPCGLLFSTLDSITGQHPSGELLASLLVWFTRLLGACQPLCWAWGYSNGWTDTDPLSWKSDSSGGGRYGTHESAVSA